MHSCIYEGRVGHCRYQPLVHRFRYRLMAMYLDLDELAELTAPGGLISTAPGGGVSRPVSGSPWPRAEGSECAASE